MTEPYIDARQLWRELIGYQPFAEIGNEAFPLVVETDEYSLSVYSAKWENGKFVIRTNG